MKYIYIVILFISFINKTFSYNIDDYTLFNKAFKYNLAGDYKKSLFYYKIYEKNFYYSYIISSNYANYYIGKNYMDMNRLDDALFYFNKAVYVPISYVKQLEHKTNYFQYQRDYNYGVIYLKKNDVSKSKIYLKRLVTDYYDPDLEIYQKKSLQILKKFDIKYKYIYEVKYQQNFTNIKKLDTKTLEGISNYFFQKQEYNITLKVLKNISTFSVLKNNLKIRYIKSLLKLKKNNSVILLTTGINKNNIQLVYLRALAFEYLKDYNRAIYNYKLLEDSKLKNLALLKISKLYYQLQKYQLSYNLANLINNNDEELQSLKLDLYIKFKDKKNYMEVYKTFEKLYPENSKIPIYYMIYKNLQSSKKNPWELFNYPIFFASNYIVRTYIDSLDTYKIKKTYRNSVLKDIFLKIGKLNNIELLEVAIQSTTFDLNEGQLNDRIIIVDTLISNKFYKKAYTLTKLYKTKFYKYKNLLSYVYPKYYQDEVKIANKNYNIPESLIYTIMLVQSEFDKKNNTKNRIGLMGIPKSEIKDSLEMYLEPQKNIEKAVELIAKLYMKNNSMALKTIIQYCFNEKILNKLNFEIDGDLKMELILNDEVRKKIEKIANIFAFYTTLYN